jgi:hypothetical protein
MKRVISLLSISLIFVQFSFAQSKTEQEVLQLSKDNRIAEAMAMDGR